MGNILIRNLDDDVISNLKAQAKRHHRSLEGEIRYILTDGVSRKTQVAEFREFAKRVMDADADTQRSDSVDLIREDRDR